MLIIQNIHYSCKINRIIVHQKKIANEKMRFLFYSFFCSLYLFQRTTSSTGSNVRYRIQSDQPRIPIGLGR